MKNTALNLKYNFSNLDKYEMNAIRGGNNGGSVALGEDILLPDPEPGDTDKDE